MIIQALPRSDEGTNVTQKPRWYMMLVTQRPRIFVLGSTDYSLSIFSVGSWQSVNINIWDLKFLRELCLVNQVYLIRILWGEAWRKVARKREREYRGGVVDVGPHGAVVERHGRAVIAGELCDCLLSVQAFPQLPQCVQLPTDTDTMMYDVTKVNIVLQGNFMYKNHTSVAYSFCKRLTSPHPPSPRTKKKRDLTCDSKYSNKGLFFFY